MSLLAELCYMGLVESFASSVTCAELAEFALSWLQGTLDSFPANMAKIPDTTLL
jgi:hypothetical protein